MTLITSRVEQRRVATGVAIVFCLALSAGTVMALDSLSIVWPQPSTTQGPALNVTVILRAPGLSAFQFEWIDTAVANADPDSPHVCNPASWWPSIGKWTMVVNALDVGREFGYQCRSGGALLHGLPCAVSALFSQRRCAQGMSTTSQYPQHRHSTQRFQI